MTRLDTGIAGHPYGGIPGTERGQIDLRERRAVVHDLRCIRRIRVLDFYINVCVRGQERPVEDPVTDFVGHRYPAAASRFECRAIDGYHQ
ncbi:hypothetical protein D3C77_366390 [compost metagenome]